jgi:hypothetical protein
MGLNRKYLAKISVQEAATLLCQSILKYPIYEYANGYAIMYSFRYGSCDDTAS